MIVINDDDIDTTEVPELTDLSDVILTRPGESLVDKIRSARITPKNLRSLAEENDE